MPKIPFICKNCGKEDSCDTENCDGRSLQVTRRNCNYREMPSLWASQQNRISFFRGIVWRFRARSPLKRNWIG